MLTVIENKRRTVAAAATAVLLLLLGFAAGRLNDSTPASAAPQIAALTAQTLQLRATARSQTAVLQHDARQLDATNTRLAGQLAAARACANRNHTRACLRHALR